MERTLNFKMAEALNLTCAECDVEIDIESSEIKECAVCPSNIYLHRICGPMHSAKHITSPSLKSNDQSLKNANIYYNDDDEENFAFECVEQADDTSKQQRTKNSARQTSQISGKDDENPKCENITLTQVYNTLISFSSNLTSQVSSAIQEGFGIFKSEFVYVKNELKSLRKDIENGATLINNNTKNIENLQKRSKIQEKELKEILYRIKRLENKKQNSVNNSPSNSHSSFSSNKITTQEIIDRISRMNNIMRHNKQFPNNKKYIKFVDGEPTLLDLPPQDSQFNTNYSKDRNEIDLGNVMDYEESQDSQNSNQNLNANNIITLEESFEASNNDNKNNDLDLDNVNSNKPKIKSVQRLTSIQVGGPSRRGRKPKSLYASSQPNTCNEYNNNDKTEQRRNFKNPFNSSKPKNLQPRTRKRTKST